MLWLQALFCYFGWACWASCWLGRVGLGDGELLCVDGEFVGMASRTI